MNRLLECVTTGYNSTGRPCSYVSLDLEDEARMLGYILSVHGKPLPTEITCSNSVWHLDANTRAVTALPKDQRAGIVYMNGDNRALVLRD